MNRYLALGSGIVGLVTGLSLPVRSEPATLLARPEEAHVNAAASPKHDDRVLVYSSKPISGSVLEHGAGGREVLLDVGAQDGVRFGHAFQLAAQGSGTVVGIARVVELQRERCVARVSYRNEAPAPASLKGLSAVCAPPTPEPRATVIRCAFGKEVWQTESLENRLIRGLLEGSGRNEVQILIQEEAAGGPRGE